MFYLIFGVICALASLVTGIMAIVQIFKKNWKKFFIFLATAIVTGSIFAVCFFMFIAQGIGGSVRT